MKAMLISIVVVACVAQPMAAGEPNPQPSLCATDSPACRSLAIGVAKLELSDSIDRMLDSRAGGALLCPQDNPNCCPPHLLPYCAQLEHRVILDARQQFHTALQSQFDNPCLWTSYCDLLLEGGLDIVDTGPDYPIPPRDCPCGTRQNPLTGVCEDRVCTVRGIPVPCGLTCGIDDLVVANADSERLPPPSNLARHLRDREVQLEAAKRLHDDLQAALEAVEKEIGELSSYDK